MKKSLCFAAFTAGTMLAGTGIASAQEAQPPADQSPVHPHTVAAGESLSMISLSELGTTERWAEIFALNRNTLASPEVIEVGQVLDIPGGGRRRRHRGTGRRLSSAFHGRRVAPDPISPSFEGFWSRRVAPGVTRLPNQ